MSLYADTSFLIALYTLDGHSSAAARALTAAPGPILFPALSDLELHNALSLRIFRKEMTPDEVATAILLIQADVTEGTLSAIPLPESAFARARQLVSSYSASLGTRSLDILPVACALELQAKAFFTFDRIQNRLAHLVGLRTL